MVYEVVCGIFVMRGKYQRKSVCSFTRFPFGSNVLRFGSKFGSNLTVNVFSLHVKE